MNNLVMFFGNDMSVLEGAWGVLGGRGGGGGGGVCNVSNPNTDNTIVSSYVFWSYYIHPYTWHLRPN